MRVMNFVLKYKSTIIYETKTQYLIVHKKKIVNNFTIRMHQIFFCDGVYQIFFCDGIIKSLVISFFLNLRIHVPNAMVCFSIHIKPMPGYLVLLIGILYYLVTNKNNYYMTINILDSDWTKHYFTLHFKM